MIKYVYKISYTIELQENKVCLIFLCHQEGSGRGHGDGVTMHSRPCLYMSILCFLTFNFLVFNQFIYFKLEHSQLTMLCQFQVYSKVIQLYIYMYLFCLFPFRLLYTIQQSSLYYTIGPYWLSILNTAVCTCPSQIITSPNPSSLVAISLFYMSILLNKISTVFILNIVLQC